MRRIGAVAIVLMGLWVISLALSLVASSSWALGNLAYPDAGAALALIAFVLGIGALGLFGAWLVGNRDKIAARLFDDTPAGAHLGAFDVLRVGLILFGVSLLAASAVRLIGAVSMWSTYASIARDPDAWNTTMGWWDPAADTLVGLVQLAFGLLLARRSSSIAQRLWGNAE